MLNRKTILQSLFVFLLILSNSIYAQGVDQDAAESDYYNSKGVQCLMSKIDAEFKTLWASEKDALENSSPDLEKIQDRLTILRGKQAQFHVLRQEKPTDSAQESGSMGAMKIIFPEYSDCAPNE